MTQAFITMNIKFLRLFIDGRLILNTCAFSLFLKKGAIKIEKWFWWHSLRLLDSFYSHYITNSMFVVVIIELLIILKYLVNWNLAVSNFLVVPIIIFICQSCLRGFSHYLFFLWILYLVLNILNLLIKFQYFTFYIFLFFTFIHFYFALSIVEIYLFLIFMIFN